MSVIVLVVVDEVVVLVRGTGYATTEVPVRGTVGVDVASTGDDVS